MAVQSWAGALEGLRLYERTCAIDPFYFPGNPGNLRVISLIFFLYCFLVRLSRNQGTSARVAWEINEGIGNTRQHQSGQKDKIIMISGIFFLTHFLVRLSGYQELFVLLSKWYF